MIRAVGWSSDSLSSTRHRDVVLAVIWTTVSLWWYFPVGNSFSLQSQSMVAGILETVCASALRCRRDLPRLPTGSQTFLDKWMRLCFGSTSLSSVYLRCIMPTPSAPSHKYPKRSRGLKHLSTFALGSYSGRLRTRQALLGLFKVSFSSAVKDVKYSSLFRSCHLSRSLVVLHHLILKRLLKQTILGGECCRARSLVKILATILAFAAPTHTAPSWPEPPVQHSFG